MKSAPLVVLASLAAGIAGGAIGVRFAPRPVEPPRVAPPPATPSADRGLAELAARLDEVESRQADRARLESRLALLERKLAEAAPPPASTGPVPEPEPPPVGAAPDGPKQPEPADWDPAPDSVEHRSMVDAGLSPERARTFVNLVRHWTVSLHAAEPTMSPERRKEFHASIRGECSTRMTAEEAEAFARCFPDLVGGGPGDAPVPARLPPGPPGAPPKEDRR